MSKLSVVIVSGAPCAGKSRYVSENRLPGDLVLDIDAIRCALGGEAYEPSQLRLGVACEARDAVIRRLNKHGWERTVWWVQCVPRTADLNVIQGRVMWVAIPQMKDECIRRARAERPLEWLAAIDAHFEQFPEQNVADDPNVKLYRRWL